MSQTRRTFVITGAGSGIGLATARAGAGGRPGRDGGALPTLHAATEPDLPGGSYIGPDGLGEVTGAPRPVGSSAASHDRVVARALGDRAVELTDVRPDVASPST